ncbi:MAG: hypothetical protein ACM3ZF_13855 [Mycobacterium leprae]
MAASDAAAHGHVLGSDDDVPAATYTHQARGLLADAAARLEDAAWHANQALSDPSHLKVTTPRPGASSTTP